MKIICSKCQQHLDIEYQGIYECPCGQKFLLDSDGTVKFQSPVNHTNSQQKDLTETIHCPKCFNEFSYDETYLGCTLQCPCGHKWMLPQNRDSLKRLESKLFQRHSKNIHNHTNNNHVQIIANSPNKEKKQNKKLNSSVQSKTKFEINPYKHIRKYFSNFDFDDVSALLTVFLNVILVIILLSIVSIFSYRSCSSTYQKIKTQNEEYKIRIEKYGSNIDAQRYLESTILGILKAPSTAKITFTQKPKFSGITYYDFKGYWDAQNSFGVYLRTYFKICVKYENGRYIIETVKTFQ